MSHPFLSDMDVDSDAAKADVGSTQESGHDEQMGDAFALEGQAETPPRRNQSAMLLGGVLLVAVATLWLMRTGGAAALDQSIGDVELKIESALAQVTTEDGSLVSATDRAVLAADTDKVIARFTDNPAQQQVPLDQLRANPFVGRNRNQNAQVTEPVAVTPIDPDVQRLAQRQRVLKDEASRLTLQTVMNGRQPMAVVSGDIVRVGDQLGSFTVTRIQPMAVTLTADDHEFYLMMERPEPR